MKQVTIARASFLVAPAKEGVPEASAAAAISFAACLRLMPATLVFPSLTCPAIENARQRWFGSARNIERSKPLWPSVQGESARRAGFFKELGYIAPQQEAHS
jgi:hypothetical protein